MKFCIDFYGDNTLDLLQTADEINIILSKIKDLDNLGEFCEIHKGQRINLVIVENYGEEENNQLFDFAFDFQNEKKGIYNVVIGLPFYKKEIINAKLEKYPDAKFFFTFCCSNWDTFYILKNIKVTDIYIDAGLGFELDKLAPLAHEANMQIRAFPNIAKSFWDDIPDLQKFWIRPEDTELYEDYIDVYEFAYANYEQQKVYYEIYFKDKKWYGDLKEIIFDLKDSLNSTTLLPNFAERRIKCGRRCMKGGTCQMCKVISDLAKTLKEKELLIENIEENKEEENGERSNSEGGSSEENIE